MWRVSSLTIFFHLLVASSCFAYTLNAPQRAAYATLKSSSYFAVGGVGAAGTISGSEAALRMLLAHKQCVLIFQDLLREARVEGQLYALLGLKAKVPPVFRQKINVYLSRQETVDVMEGCQGSKEAVSWVAGKIQRGDYAVRLTPKKPRRSERHRAKL